MHLLWLPVRSVIPQHWLLPRRVVIYVTVSLKCSMIFNKWISCHATKIIQIWSINIAWIRYFDFLVDLSFKLVNKKWQTSIAADKEKIVARKINIQNGLKSKLVIIAHHPKPGFGSSNHGNSTQHELQSHTDFIPFCKSFQAATPLRSQQSKRTVKTKRKRL